MGEPVSEINEELVDGCNSEDPTDGPSSNLHEVHSIPRSKSDTILPSLAVAAPSALKIMEETSSPVHIREASHTYETEQHFGASFNQDSPHSQNRNEEGMLLVGETSGYNTTRGGRPIKPTQKVQDMEWKTVRGRGKRGRRGRGNYYH
ncbi:hypothetical protein DY000_02000851 [Brassica cretica]|uniref:AT-hook motif nuclear-localized protein n=1 Tax=Brassica cretica TaxID=69181 RepID=A0ABQ7C6U2_BRACR|nr:hypothetical protein DY000_02000851 [Brassica cretica]